MLRKISLCACLLLLAAGCAPKHPRLDLPPTYLEQAAWRAQVQKLRQIKNWDIDGRIASSATWGFSGSLNWQQRGNQFLIQASGPLGIGAVELAGNPAYVKVVSGEQVYETFDPEHDLQRVIGWPVSIEHLRQWVLAVPIDARAYSLKLGSDGWPESIMQGGWRVEYKSFQELKGYVVPRKIVAKRDDMEVKLVISDWHPQQPESALSEDGLSVSLEDQAANTRLTDSVIETDLTIIGEGQAGEPSISKDQPLSDLVLIDVSDEATNAESSAEVVVDGAAVEPALLDNVVNEVLSEMKAEPAIYAAAEAKGQSTKVAVGGEVDSKSSGQPSRAAENPFFSSPNARRGPRR